MLIKPLVCRISQCFLLVYFTFFSHLSYAMRSQRAITWERRKIRPSSFDCTLCDALGLADWTQQQFFLATIFPEALLFFNLPAFAGAAPAFAKALRRRQVAQAGNLQSKIYIDNIP